MKTIITIDIDGTEGLISEENCTGMKFKVSEDSPHREETIATSLLDYLLFEKSESIEEPAPTFNIGDTVYVKSVDKEGQISGVISERHTEADIQKIQDLEQAELEKAFELGREDALSEIVRCNDCKHSERWYRDKRRCFLWAEDGIDVFEDGFCNYAERRNL